MKSVHQIAIFVAAGTLVMWSLGAISGVLSSSARLGLDGEPVSQEVYNNMRTFWADPTYYYLQSASALNVSPPSERLLEDSRLADGRYAPANFQFSLVEMYRKMFVIRSYVNLAERLALHVFDEPSDIELATGPQVNQDRCGLILAYMNNQVKKHLSSVNKASERSIFEVMFSFDSIRTHLRRYGNVLTGDHEACLSSTLNVIKSELATINSSEAENYFRHGASEDAKLELQEQSGPRLVLAKLRHYLGPLLGFKRPEEIVSSQKYRHLLRLQPMRQCMAGIRFAEWHNTSYALRAHAMRVAVCLPDICDSRSLAIHGEAIKQLTDFHMKPLADDYYIHNLYCLPDDQSALTWPFNYPEASLFIGFVVVWLSLTCWVSVNHFWRTSSTRQKSKSDRMHCLRAWNIAENFHDFLDTRRLRPQAPSQADTKSDDTTRPAVNMAPLEGIKVISALGVITPHALMLLMANARNSDASHDLLSNSWIGMAISVCPSVVDVFFVITGLITSRSLFLKPERRAHLLAPKFWLIFLLNRYLRIMPLYLMIHLFIRSSFRFIGSGPLWDYGTSKTGWSGICNSESLWDLIIPRANFKSPGDHCNSVGWYLANDIQFALITPILLAPYLLSPFLGYLSAFLWLLITMIQHVRYFVASIVDVRGSFDWSVTALGAILSETPAGYVYPHYRAVSYVIGLAAGHLLVSYELGRIRKWPNWFVCTSKLLAYFVVYFLCVLPSAISLVPLDLPENTLRWIGALQAGTIHTITSLAAAGFVLLLVTGHFPNLARLFTWTPMGPLANAALSTQLVHFPVLYYRNQSITVQPHLTGYLVASTITVWIIESFIVSSLVHVLFELPLRKSIGNLMSFAGLGVSSTTKNEGTVQTSASKRKQN